MVGDKPKISESFSKTYTFNEAVEYMKMKDKEPTFYTIRWRNVRTGKEVIIGYT